MNVALLGFGTVGVGVYELLKNQENINVKYVLDIKLHNDISAISTTDFNDILNDETVDTVVEVIGGLHPAYEFVSKSLKKGKNVVSANKFLISTFYKELSELATNNNVAFRYTAAVGGGIPWLVNLERVKRIAKVDSVYGIMNGTSNFILDSMHTGSLSFETALGEAQKLGYAESDPSADIDGLDTLCKVVLSANIAFSKVINKEDASVLGIRDISSSDINICESLNCVCRLMAHATINEDSVSVYVEPEFVSLDKPEATVKQNLNMISFDAQYVGRESFYGFGAGRYPTAYTVVGDCVDIANGTTKLYNNIFDAVKINNNACIHSYYVNTEFCNEWFKNLKKEKTACGVITEQVSVKEMHDFVKQAKDNGYKCFAAAVL